MSDQSDTEEESAEAVEEATAGTEADAETETEAGEAVIDLDSAQEYEATVEELQETVEAQQEEISELQDLLLDLSTRVADDRGMGVCPDCHGPVQKVRRWLNPTTIECRRCGRVFHEY